MRLYACCIDVKRVPMALKRPSDNIDEVNTTDPHDMFVTHEMFELRTRKRDLKAKGFRV